MWSRHFTGLPAIAAACAIAMIACAKRDPDAGTSLAIVVPADALVCEVLGQSVPCADVPTHVEKTLQISTSKLIVISDRMSGRTDDAVTTMADELRKVGYSKVMVVGFVTERL